MALLRTATAADGDPIVDVFQAARAAGLPWLAVVHDDAEDRVHFGAIAASGTATVAVVDDRVVGFVVVGESRIDHLYVHPEMWQQGIGAALLRDAQARRPGGLDLWVFQRNTTAIAFYEAHGFRIVEETDGSTLEEKEPDARMVWPRA